MLSHNSRRPAAFAPPPSLGGDLRCGPGWPGPIAERPVDRRSLQRRLLAFALLPFVSACGAGLKHAPSLTPSAPVAENSPQTAPQPAPPLEDPVLTLIAQSEEHFKTGLKELELGHVERARQEFDEAVNVLLESTYGGRTEPRIREHFDRLIDRISSYEVKALATGDGFAEKKSEPASIDELLALSETLSPAPAPDLKDAVQSGLQDSPPDIPIPLNQKVLSYVALFQGRLHDFIQEGMTRGAKYLPMIQNVFRAEGLPLDLAYIPLVESAFKPNALSRAKAKGVWQFVRGTGVENGLRQDWYIDERSDPEKATAAAAKYLSTLVTMFDGDWHLALASYNGGPGRVQRAMKRGNQTDFWKLSAKSGLLPRETREYVPMILAAVVVAKSPEQYGFSFGPLEPQRYDTVTLPAPVDLRKIAEWADTTIDEIQALNPELRRWTTPVKDTDYEIKVPSGTSDLVSARLAELAGAELATLKYYTVKRGDTITTIARKLSVGRTDLAEANYMKVTARLSVGQQLMVPQETTVLMSARADRPVPVAESRPVAADTVVPAVINASNASDFVKTSYVIKKGDTLASIARAFSTTVARLQSWNGLTSSQIRAGQRLTIYTARAN
jgi:membrane-bound lytic murein transglycosylase D